MAHAQQNMRALRTDTPEQAAERLRVAYIGTVYEQTVQKPLTGLLASHLGDGRQARPQVLSIVTNSANTISRHEATATNLKRNAVPLQECGKFHGFDCGAKAPPAQRIMCKNDFHICQFI
jgi:hypothetical protein